LFELIQIYLTGLNDNSCEISYKIIDNFPQNFVIRNLHISTKIHCTIKGNSEIFHVNFTNPEIISDLYQNQLKTNILHAKAMRKIYYSETEEQIIGSAGQIFNISSLFMLILMIALSLLQSFAIGMFWAFINMLQVLFYIPILNCSIPSNLELFLTQYMSVCKVVIPFKIFPGYNEFLGSLLNWFKTEPVNEKFEQCGYESKSFIYNFANDLVTWTILGIIYGILMGILYKYPNIKYF